MSLQVKLVSALIKVDSDPFSKNVTQIARERIPMSFSGWAMKKNTQRPKKKEVIRWPSMKLLASTRRIMSSKFMLWRMIPLLMIIWELVSSTLGSTDSSHILRTVNSI